MQPRKQEANECNFDVIGARCKVWTEGTYSAQALSTDFLRSNGTCGIRTIMNPHFTDVETEALLGRLSSMPQIKSPVSSRSGFAPTSEGLQAWAHLTTPVAWWSCVIQEGVLQSWGLAWVPGAKCTEWACQGLSQGLEVRLTLLASVSQTSLKSHP